MHRQGYDLQLTQYDDGGWRAFLRDGRKYDSGNGGSPTNGTTWLDVNGLGDAVLNRVTSSVREQLMTETERLKACAS